MADEIEVEAATGRDELAPLALSDLDITAQELDFEGERERGKKKGSTSSSLYNPELPLHSICYLTQIRFRSTWRMR
jgi:hypothetical protein